MSLRQIANTTRISVMSLEAVERSDLSRLPGGIFTRAFIRAYAQEVGLDPDRTVQDFLAELPPDAATATAHPAAHEDGEALDSERKAVATAIRLILVALPIIGLVVYYGTQRAQTPVALSDAPAGVVEAPPPPLATSPVVPEAAVAAPAAPAVTKPSGLTMEIAPRGTCWVSVTVDGEPTFSGLMNAGDKRVIQAMEQILLNVGDAGVFIYTLNGRAGRPLGAPGEVVSTRITLSNLAEFSAP